MYYILSTARLSRQFHFVAVLAMAFTIQSSSNVPTLAQAIRSKASTISVEQLQQATVIGTLGEPIGTLVTIEGVFQDMTFTMGKADEGRIVLVINRVNGKEVTQPVRFDFGQDSLFRRLNPKDGDQFKLIGFEYGLFTGDVEGAAELEVTMAKARAPFRYKSQFEVLKDANKNISQRDAF